MNTAWITDSATITPFGDDLIKLWSALVLGRTAIKPVERFAVQNYHAGIAACIQDLTANNERSMISTLVERLCAQLAAVPPHTLLITATTKSGIDNLEKIRRGYPAAARDVMVTAMFEDVQRRLKLTGECINISAACASSTVAMAQAAALIGSGREDAVLVVCLDLVSEFVFSGFSALQALSKTPCRPFDRDRSGLSLGEGAAAILLMSSERARRERRSPLGTVLGWGIANDATHITAPARDGSGLTRAIRLALRMTALKHTEITAISAHGTGTVYNDRMELKAFHQIFGSRTIPIYSIKGAIGHTLGAAGGIEVAVGLRALQEQTVPPTVGFANPESGAENCVKSAPAAFCGDYLLTTNSGFGGINAALILGKGSPQ